MAKDDPRGHHLLAKLYQRGFANERDKVRVVARSTGASYTAGIAKVFKERDFYAFRDEDGELRQDVEKLLADEVEDPAAHGFAAMRAGEFPLVPEQREAVARFAAAQLVRGRHFRRQTEPFLQGLDRHTAALMAQHYTDAHWLNAIGRVPSEEEKTTWATSGLATADERKLQMLDAGLANIDEMTEHLLRRTWTLVGFQQPCLLTSEEPVTLWSPAGSSLGVGNAEDIGLPVSTTQLLVLTHPGMGLPEEKAVGDDALAAKANARTLSWPPGERLLMSPDIDGHPLDAALVPTGLAADETLAIIRGSALGDVQ